MIFDDTRPVTFQDTLPAATDVLVVGGGVAGICSAYYLARAGLSVVVCEKGRVAGEQSSRNWGWIRQQGRDPAEVPLASEANRLWGEISADLDADIGFARTGVLFCAADQEQLSELEDWLKVAQQHQLDTRLLSSAEVDNLLTGPPQQWFGGLYTPSDAKAEPFVAVPAIARATQRLGVKIHERCAVRSLVTTAGKVTGAITEQGEIRAQAVLCAGGAWTSKFLGNLGISLPQLTVRATVLRTAPAPDLFSGAAIVGHLGIRRRQDGGYTIATGSTHDHYVSADSLRHFRRFLPAMRESFQHIEVRLDGDLLARLDPRKHWADDAVSPFERTRILNPEPSPTALAAIRDGLTQWLPELAEVPVAQAWAGMIDVTPDVVPVLDQVPTHPGLYVATGFSGHGFGLGPATGRIMADMVQGRPESHDLSRFRFSRFADGSKIDPGPGL